MRVKMPNFCVLKDSVSRFLLVFLSIKTILQETTIYRRRQRLSAMKNGLDLGEAYEAMLERIKAQGGEKARLGMAVLMWISHSRRPLQVDEICHALAIKVGSNDFNNDDIPATSTLISCCQGLVTMDKSASTVRLVHFTLQEYLGTHPDLFDKAHSMMAETCLTYLNFQHVKDPPAGPSTNRGHSTTAETRSEEYRNSRYAKGRSVTPPPDPRRTPFLQYCSLYWGTHMRMELSDCAKTFALELLGQFDNHVSAKSLWNSINGGLPFYYRPSKGQFSALHCISYFGIAEIANTLIKMDRWDVNQRDGAGMTPLIWAARYGHEEVVRLLLGNKHIEPDQQDTNYGRTALSWAAGNGYEGVVRLFLGPRFVNPGTLGRWWGKAPRVAGLLFSSRYVNPDSSSESGRTPLSWAAENGHEGVVKLLLAREDVSPNSISKSGLTPLPWAAMNGHEGTVKLLLRRDDVNPDIPDRGYGRTPLSWAAGNGHEGIVKLLLGRGDVSPDAPDARYGQTPLLWAAQNGRVGAVKLLLQCKDVNPHSPSRSGRTPLSLAASNGHEGIVKLMLEPENVNSDIPDRGYGRTPLSWAAEKGHEGIVKLLLARKYVNPDIPDRAYGRTPLSWAAGNGHEGIVKLLLGREDVSPDSLGESSRTPLLSAARNGHEGTVKLLLGQEDVNPNSPDTEYARTPLSWAAGNGHEGIVKLLLGREDVYPDSPSISGRTPLSWAAGSGREGVVKLLLGRGDINPNNQNKHGRTPLLLAAKNGHEGTVKLLLGRKDVNPDIPETKYGQTPLSRAAEKGRAGIVKLLLERDDVNPNSSGKSGQTPITLATLYRHRKVIELLQARISPPIR